MGAGGGRQGKKTMGNFKSKGAIASWFGSIMAKERNLFGPKPNPENGQFANIYLCGTSGRVKPPQVADNLRATPTITPI
jgi:hypothetical protein